MLTEYFPIFVCTSRNDSYFFSSTLGIESLQPSVGVHKSFQDNRVPQETGMNLWRFQSFPFHLRHLHLRPCRGKKLLKDVATNKGVCIAADHIISQLAVDFPEIQKKIIHLHRLLSVMNVMTQNKYINVRDMKVEDFVKRLTECMFDNNILEGKSTSCNYDL